MPYHWPKPTEIPQLILVPDERDCPLCGRFMHICDHREHKIFTMKGPLLLINKLIHCPDLACPGNKKTWSPKEELNITMPWWVVGWDVFAYIGHRRFARHWSVPQIRMEINESFAIPLSDDAIEKNIMRYQRMVGAWHQDPKRLLDEYQDVKDLVFSTDGLQPEKGHETLYVFRELRKKRVWFAASMLSSGTEELKPLFEKVKTLAEALGKPIILWMSDKQEALVKNIASVFPGTPHRLCKNHFIKDLAKPILEADSEAKVRMRRKIRGLRAIEREVLQEKHQEQEAEPKPNDEAGSKVILDYTAAVRGILNSSQGGPLAPPGIKMADALGEVRQSLQRAVEEKKKGSTESRLQRLVSIIDRGLDEVKEEQAAIREQTQDVRRVDAILQPEAGSKEERQAKFEEIMAEFKRDADPIREHLWGVMSRFESGLFAGPDLPDLPEDNLDLERWFRNPKGHERRIHGHAHAGIRIVTEGPILAPTLDAHILHPTPFTPEDLRPYAQSPVLPSENEAKHRQSIMRQARSKKFRPQLLAELEARYHNST